MEKRARRPSASMAVSFLALAVALGGTAWAASRIGTDDIRDGAVTTQKLHGGAVKAKKIGAGAVKAAKLPDGVVRTAKIHNGAVTGTQVADDSLNDTKMSDYELVGNSYIRVTATDGANEAAALAAAPETLLFKKGQLEIYAKCYRDTGTDTTFATTFSRTSADGATQEGEDDLPGGNAATDFLNVNTAETDRELSEETATGNDANYDEDEWALASPDGTGLTGQGVVGAKNGTLAGGDGLYGAGNVCIFQGSILG